MNLLKLIYWLFLGFMSQTLYITNVLSFTSQSHSTFHFFNVLNDAFELYRDHDLGCHLIYLNCKIHYIFLKLIKKSLTISDKSVLNLPYPSFSYLASKSLIDSFVKLEYIVNKFEIPGLLSRQI